MARGMVNGEAIVSQAQTKEFDEGYERTFGKDKRPVRGRWVYRDGRLVDLNDPEPEQAKDAPIMVDRWMEGTKSPIDGADIGSRRKLNQYMKDRGLAIADDFKDTWAAKERERERKTRDVNYDDRSERQKLDDRKRLYHHLTQGKRNG